MYENIMSDIGKKTTLVYTTYSSLFKAAFQEIRCLSIGEPSKIVHDREEIDIGEWVIKVCNTLEHMLTLLFVKRVFLFCHFCTFIQSLSFGCETDFGN